MKFKPDRCQSFTRGSNYKVQCKCKGYWCKTSKKFRCKFHAGLSQGPVTLEGKLRSLANLKNSKNFNYEKIIGAHSRRSRKHYSKISKRKAIGSDLPRSEISKSFYHLQMDEEKS